LTKLYQLGKIPFGCLLANAELLLDHESLQQNAFLKLFENPPLPLVQFHPCGDIGRDICRGICGDTADTGDMGRVIRRDMGGTLGRVPVTDRDPVAQAIAER